MAPFLLRNGKGRLHLIQRLLRKNGYSPCLDIRSEFLQVMHHTQCRSSGTIRRRPADILFDRGSLCYARPAYIPRSGVIVAGLPPKRSYTYMKENILSYNHADILNVLNPSFHRSTIAQFQTRDYHKRMDGCPTFIKIRLSARIRSCDGVRLRQESAQVLGFCRPRR